VVVLWTATNNNKMELTRTSSAGSPTLPSKDFLDDVDNVAAVYSNYKIGKNIDSLLQQLSARNGKQR